MNGRIKLSMDETVSARAVIMLRSKLCPIEYPYSRAQIRVDDIQNPMLPTNVLFLFKQAL